MNRSNGRCAVENYLVTVTLLYILLRGHLCTYRERSHLVDALVVLTLGSSGSYPLARARVTAYQCFVYHVRTNGFVLPPSMFSFLCLVILQITAQQHMKKASWVLIVFAYQAVVAQNLEIKVAILIQLLACPLSVAWRQLSLPVSLVFCLVTSACVNLPL